MHDRELAVVLPVLNEERILKQNVRRLSAFLRTHYPGKHRIVILDNGSSDSTLRESNDLQMEILEVKVLHLEKRGRGGALKAAWACEKASVLSYMDIDLATDLSFFPSMVEPLFSGQADLAIGSRLMPGAFVERGMRREILSRSYNRMVRAIFGLRVFDAQCEFKGITATAAGRLLPILQDDGWFMDTELLVLAQRFAFRTFELPVRWKDRRESRVVVWKTILANLIAIWRLKRRLSLGILKPPSIGP
jgi:glycosyltransferase involved in cell wall biosynthesis